jgi:hypothetical protein
MPFRVVAQSRNQLQQLQHRVYPTRRQIVSKRTNSRKCIQNQDMSHETPAIQKFGIYFSEP